MKELNLQETTQVNGGSLGLVALVITGSPLLAVAAEIVPPLVGVAAEISFAMAVGMLEVTSVAFQCTGYLAVGIYSLGKSAYSSF